MLLFNKIMKLYTEEQVIQMIEKSRETGLTAEFLILTTTPIKLPSDEEIEEQADNSFALESYNQIFLKGANYVLNKIQGGNNEQQ